MSCMGRDSSRSFVAFSGLSLPGVMRHASTALCKAGLRWSCARWEDIHVARAGWVSAEAGYATVQLHRQYSIMVSSARRDQESTHGLACWALSQDSVPWVGSRVLEE